MVLRLLRWIKTTDETIHANTAIHTCLQILGEKCDHKNVKGKS